MREFYEQIGPARYGWGALVSAGLLNNLVGKAKFAAQLDPGITAKQLIQLLDLCFKEGSFVGVVNSVVRMRRGHHHRYAIGGGAPTHLEGLFERRRAIIYF